MDDSTAKSTPAVVVSANPGDIGSSSKQTSTAQDITLRLCPRCEDSFYQYLLFTAVVESARKGCDQCTAAERGVRLACPEFFVGIDHPAPPSDSVYLWNRSDGGLLGSHLSVSLMHNTSVKRRKTIELIQLGSAGTDKLRLPVFAQYERLPEARFSDSTYEIIRNWINACVNRNDLPGIKGLLPFGHSRCDKNDFKPLPKRVLSLENEKVRLVETNEGDCGKYACLSYCWGSAGFLRTLTSNLEQHKEGMSLQDMPTLFEDVVKVCCKLSIPYLWIDALCIIQDSDADWAEQASKMAEIYSNSFLTIAATAAQDPHRSCWRGTHRPQNSIAFHTKAITSSNSLRVQQWNTRGEAKGEMPHAIPIKGEDGSFKKNVSPHEHFIF